MHLENHPGLLKNYPGIVKLFENLRDKSMSAGDINEKFAMQAHYYSFLVKTVRIQYEEKGIKGFIKLYVAFTLAI